MPPKPRFTREEIVAALDIVSRKGIEALTARELGETLGSSISCSSCAKTAAPSALTMCSVSWVIRRSAASRRSAATMASVRRKRALFEHVWIYTFGVGALCATRVCRFSEEQLGRMLSTEFQAMMLLVKSGGQS